ncbi:Niban-like protein 1 [Takifugu flavidus]|uniref:Niban-like protein 1 n=2 Tax=Takifugu flavidus TaxID=433684 RepID=A0A5C6N4T7_9TELE|nr:Niban-like protein 1 [Takifugu flavidus]
MMAVKEAAVQRRHNLYRDSIVLSNSDPSLHLLGDNPSIDWAGEYGGGQEKTDGPEKEEKEEEGGEGQKKRRMKQVVSMIQVEDSDLPSPETGAEVPSIRDIPEEDGQQEVEQEVEQEDGQEEEQEEEQEDGQEEEQEVGQEEEEEEQEVHSEAANPPDLSSASVSEEKRIQPEEQRKDSEPLEGETAAGVLEDKDTPSDLEGSRGSHHLPPQALQKGPRPPLPPSPHDGG